MLSARSIQMFAPNPLLIPPHLATDPLEGGVHVGVASLMTMTSLFAATFGFGDAVIAVPLLALLFSVDPPEALPLQTVVSTCLAVLLLSMDTIQGKAESVGRWKESLLLFIAAAAGVPLGVRALVTLDPCTIRTAVGGLLVAYGFWSLQAKRDAKDGDDERGSAPPARVAVADTSENGWPLQALPFGLLAGTLCGALGEPGPPAVVYGSLQRWSPLELRLMLQRFFLPVQVVTINEFAARGLLSAGVIEQAVWTLPSVVAAAAIGTKLNRAVDPERFAVVIDAIVVVLGCICLYTAFEA